MSRLIELFRRSIRVLRMQSLLRRVETYRVREVKLYYRFLKLEKEQRNENRRDD